MQDINYTGKYFNESKYNIKIRTGEDILNATGDAICGELLVANGGDYPGLYIATKTNANNVELYRISEITSDNKLPINNDYSLSLDGVDDYILIPANTFDLGANNWAFSIWFKFDSAGTYALFDIGTSGGAVAVAMMSATSIRLTAYSPAHNKDFDTTVSAMPTNTWQHVLVQKYGNAGGSQAKVYLNGVLINDGIFSNTTDFGINTNTSVVGKLKNYFSGYNLPGNVDEFAYFSNSLSDGGVSIGETAGGDVAGIYNSGTPGDLTSYLPVGWWRMGDTEGGTGSTITDLGSGGNDGTINGATFSTDTPSI